MIASILFFILDYGSRLFHAAIIYGIRFLFAVVLCSIFGGSMIYAYYVGYEKGSATHASQLPLGTIRYRHGYPYVHVPGGWKKIKYADASY